MDCTTLLGLTEVISLEQLYLTIYYASECEYYACIFLQLSFEETEDFIQVNTELFLIFLSKHLFKIRTPSFGVCYTAPPPRPPPPPALTGCKILTDLSYCMFSEL